MTETPEATAALRALAIAGGIPVCTRQDCANVATHIAAWVTGDVLGCEEHARAFVALGKLMGVGNVTVRPNPAAVPFRPAVPNKRFQAIGHDLLEEP